MANAVPMDTDQPVLPTPQQCFAAWGTPMVFGPQQLVGGSGGGQSIDKIRSGKEADFSSFSKLHFFISL